MDSSRKDKLYFNIKLFVIGILLWVIIVSYLNSHPGEKNSLIPSLQTLYNKGQLAIYSLLGHDTTQMQTKQSLQKMYREIAYLIESSNCNALDLIAEVEANKAAIDQLDYSQAQNNKYNYYLKAVDLKNKIEQQCTIKTPTSKNNPSTGTNQ